MQNKFSIIAGISIVVIAIILTAIYGINKYNSLSFSQKYKYQLEKARSLLEDEHSKEVFDYGINMFNLYYNELYSLDYKSTQKYTRHMNYKKPKANKKFEDFDLKLTEGDIIIDGGILADARTIRRLSYLVGLQGKAIGFEPDYNRMPEIKKFTGGLKNIEVYPFGLWKSNRTMKLWQHKRPKHSSVKKNWGFYDDLDRNNYIDAKFIKLDDFVKEKSVQRLDYLRLNIEGSELEALMGAKNTLKTLKPDLLIFLEHHPTQLFSIILYLDSLNAGYKYLLELNELNPYSYYLYASVDD